MTTRVAICTHFAVEHYRGGEKWAVKLANRLTEEPGLDVAIHSLPHLPSGERRVIVRDVLHRQVEYETAWRHDLTGVDTAYVFYHPGAHLSFPGAQTYIAGIHSWIYVSPKLFESHYGVIPTGVKLLYRLVGDFDLTRYDCVHTVTQSFDSPHGSTVFIPNFVDRTHFHPNLAPLDDEFTVFIAAAHIEEKGWDMVKQVAAQLPESIEVVATGSTSCPDIEGLGFLSEEELANRYARSHAVLHPARVDTDSMVINEALASGTPVVTSPLLSHVRRNEAVLHGTTPFEMAGIIKVLFQEYRIGDETYQRRCDLAREGSADRGIRTVYPQLRSLLEAPVEEGSPATPDDHASGSTSQKTLTDGSGTSSPTNGD